MCCIVFHIFQRKCKNVGAWMSFAVHVSLSRSLSLPYTPLLSTEGQLPAAPVLLCPHPYLMRLIKT